MAKNSLHSVRAGNVSIGGTGSSLVLFAGPCVIESRSSCVAIAKKLAELAEDKDIPLVFKASYDKANRSSVDSFRGPGLSRGLDIFREIKEKTGLPVLTDVHSEAEVPIAAQVADMLQCPAFLCRQTDLILALGHSGRAVNIKKAQFLAPLDVKHIIKKLESTGCHNFCITERGTSFGYNNLVADMRAIPIMKSFGYPVVFDATHSVQLPGAGINSTGGNAELAPVLACSAVAAGCDAVFIETHPVPKKALSDASTMLPLKELPQLWERLVKIYNAVKQR
jgi:2-dehydro-3-deoxyphosphooctonate aldolase (KDO 8-P synthase)